MNYQAINLNEELSKFNDLWSPKDTGEINEYHHKIVKIAGEHASHEHQGADKIFMVLEGEMFIVPGEADQKPFAEKECHIMIVEPKA